MLLLKSEKMNIPQLLMLSLQHMKTTIQFNNTDDFIPTNIVGWVNLTVPPISLLWTSMTFKVGELHQVLREYLVKKLKFT